MPVMKTKVAYSSSFVPAELIEACGMSPLRLEPSSTESSPAIAPVPGVCPFARAFSSAAVSEEDIAAVVLTTVCDQMRRASDLVSLNSDQPVFLMNVPHTWQTPSAREMYISELRRLSVFLAGLGGDVPMDDHLWKVMLKQEQARAGISVHREGKGVPLALVGGPLMRDHRLFDLIEQSVGFVALDATETGERAMPAVFDKALSDPFEALTDAYFGHIPDPFRRPNDSFFDWLDGKLKEREVRGIILRRYVWCDTWSAEAYRIKEKMGLPFLHLDIGEEGIDDARTLSRLQAFMEMLA